MLTASTAVAADALRGRTIIDTLKRCGVSHVISVPDIVTSEGLLRPLAEEPGIALIRVCKEDEGVSICAALSFCGRRALLLMQNTGLLDSLNALRAIGVEFGNPVCMMVGLLGKEPEASPRDSAKYGVRIIEPMLDVMGVAHCLLSTDCDLARLEAGIERAYETRSPVVFLLGRSPV
ncbi:MAG: decarboxylase [Burkholderiales bacterium]|nr:decarboxylase [Burkholderiales bacterium]